MCICGNLASRYKTWLPIKLMPKGVVFSNSETSSLHWEYNLRLDRKEERKAVLGLKRAVGSITVGVAGGGECVTRLGNVGRSAEGAPLDQGCQPESTKVSQGKSCMLIAIIIHRCSS